MQTQSRVAFRDWFRDQRDRLGISQHRMAILLDTTVASIQNWESGRTLPDLPHFQRMLEAFEVSALPTFDFKAMGRYLEAVNI